MLQLFRSAALYTTHPAVVIAAALLLFLDWCNLPDRPDARSTGATYCPFSSPYRGSMHGRPIPVVLYRTATGIQGRVELQADVKVEPRFERLDSVVFPGVPRRSGFWGMTRRVESVIFLGSDSLTTNERALVVPVVVAALEAEPGMPEAIGWPYDLLKSGSTSRTDVLIGGFIHNAFALLLAVVVVAGFPRLVIAATRINGDYVRRRIHENRSSKGLCPMCRYNLQGNPENGCSECGWNRTPVTHLATPSPPLP